MTPVLWAANLVLNQEVRIPGMVDPNAVCYMGIMRIYRNAVVQHVRATLQGRDPNNWETLITRPFAKGEWQGIEAAATRGHLGLSVRPLDKADLLSVNHFYNIFDSYFGDLFPHTLHWLTEAQQETRAQVLAWAKTIKEMRDPVIGHPIENSISSDDAEKLLYAARNILAHFNASAAEEVDTLADSLNEAIGIRNVLLSDTLPDREAIVPQFIGRQQELAKLNRWIRDPFSHVHYLVGDGGKGKTAIAYEFASNLALDPPRLAKSLECVIWLSAKTQRFEEGQTVEIKDPDFWDLHSALSWILGAYGETDIPSSIIHMQTRCIEWLTHLPALIVVDDVNSLHDDDTVEFFNERVSRTPSKVLLTSRMTLYGMGSRSLQIAGFERNSIDGISFVENIIERYGLEKDLFTRSAMNDIIQTCDGSPLFIQDLLRLCKIGERPESAIRQWRERGESARRYALEREIEVLTPPAKRALLTCALLGTASLSEIQVCADLSGPVCSDAVRELQSLFLMPSPSLIENENRFRLNTNTKELVLQVYQNTEAAKRVKNAIDARKGFDNIKVRNAIGPYIRQSISLVKMDKHIDAEATLVKARSVHHEHPDLYGVLGWVYKSWKPEPRYADARIQFTRAYELRSSKEEMYKHWSEMEQNQRRFSASADAAEKGLEMVKNSTQLSFKAGLSRSKFAKNLYDQVQYDRAKQEAEKAMRHLNNSLANEAVNCSILRKVFRAQVFNYELLVDISQSQNVGGAEAHFLRLLAELLVRWSTECPDDPLLSHEQARLGGKFPHMRV